MNSTKLQRFVDEAQNIIDGYIDNLPESVCITAATDVSSPGPRSAVIETDKSVCVLAWISIPKSYEFPEWA
jgi:hypothetical protein